MARISTYTQVTPTELDHVIGTDAEDGNATRVFSIAGLRDLIGFQTRQIASMAFDFGSDPLIPSPLTYNENGVPEIPAEYLPTPPGVGIVPLAPLLRPRFTVSHALETTSPVLTVFVRTDPSDSTLPISYEQIDPETITVIDQNNLSFSLPGVQRYIGYAIVEKGTPITP